jgi:hypothetical protein
MPRSLRRIGLAVLVASTAGVPLAAGCSGPVRARDVAGDRRPRGASSGSGEPGSSLVVPEAPHQADSGPAKIEHPRVIAKASARALALDAAHIYYGDSDDDGVYAMAKTGGEPLRIARHAPVSGALALEDGHITWIASPGDAVLRAPISGGAQPTTLRDRGIFGGVAAVGEDVFITEAVSAGGALIRVTGPTASRLAAFDGAPRAVMADKTHAYVVTASKILRTPHQRGELETIATGNRFTHAELDDAFVYVVAEVDKGRAVVRFPKAGGPLAVVARDVRDAPIEVEGGDLFFFDAVRPQLRSVRASGGESRIVAEDEGLGTVSALEADASTIYVAEGIHESGVIVAIPRR